MSNSMVKNAVYCIPPRNVVIYLASISLKMKFLQRRRNIKQNSAADKKERKY